MAWLVLKAAETERSTADRALWDRLRRQPEMLSLQRLANQFVTMVRERQGTRLACWLADCRTGPIPEFRTFAKTLETDMTAVQAALSLPWSNGGSRDRSPSSSC